MDLQLLEFDNAAPPSLNNYVLFIWTLAMALPELFGVIPTGCPIITTPTSAPAPTSLVYNLPARPFSHIVIFLLPGITLPPDTAAAVYLAAPSLAAQTQLQNPDFKFLGGIGPGKESAIFKVSGTSAGATQGSTNNGEIDMDASEHGNSGSQERGFILGISIESAASVSAQMATLSLISRASNPSPNTVQPSEALIVPIRPRQGADGNADPVMLAQRIIKNAFNFLASFSGNVPVPGGSGTAGVEVVPLKAFEDWWKKFEGRIRSDPGFLHRDAD